MLDLTGIKWFRVPNEGNDPDCLEALRQLEPHRDIRLVKRNALRSVYRLQAGEHTYFLKHDHPSSLKNYIKSLWRCKAKQEFVPGQALAEAAVPVVPFVAWGRRGFESFLISTEIPNSTPLMDAWRACRDASKSRRAFLDGFAEFLQCLVQARVEHPDLHAGNVLVKHNGETVSFYLVDVYGVRLNRTLTVSSTRVLRLAVVLARDLSIREALRLLQKVACFPETTNLAAEWHALVRFFFRRLQKRWRGRRRRLLKSSSLCVRCRTERGIWLLRRPFTYEDAEK